MGGLAIIPFVPALGEEVAAMILNIQVNEFGLNITLADQPDLLVIPSLYQREGGGFWVAMDDDRVIGTTGLLPFSPTRVALRKMFVVRASRGRGGAGQQLLDTAIAHARGKGVQEVYLGTLERLQAALRFYEKNGFQPIEARQLPHDFPRMAVDTVFLRARIATPLVGVDSGPI